MPNLSVLISGAGSIGKRHARNLRHPDILPPSPRLRPAFAKASAGKQGFGRQARLRRAGKNVGMSVGTLAIADPDEEQRELIAKELNCKAFPDFEHALDECTPDIVFICSPTKLHVSQALLAAKAGAAAAKLKAKPGAHLFIEKPLSHSLEGIEELQKAIEQRLLTCMVACNMRFHHGPATVKQLLNEGTIGTVTKAQIYTGSYLPDWRPEQDYKKSYSADPERGGAILDCIHEIDLALYYFGQATLEDAVLEDATELGIDAEGTADLELLHKSGVKSSVHLSFMEKEYKRFCSIVGSDGSIVWSINRNVVEVLDSNGTVIESHPEPEGYDMNQMYIGEVQHFLDCVENKRKPQGNLEEAIEALTIALEARGGVA